MKINFKNPIEFVDTKDFRKIIIRVFFFFDTKEEEYVYSSILPSLLNGKNNDYPTDHDYRVAKLEKYILSSGAYNEITGTKSSITFELVIPDVDTLKEDLLEDQIKFLQSNIYNPLSVDSHFDEFEFNRVLENTNNFINNIDKNPTSYLDRRLSEIVGENPFFTLDLYHHKDELNNINVYNLYQFYLDKVVNNECFVMVAGNVNHKRITQLLNKYIIHKSTKKLEVEYDFFEKIGKKKIINEKKDFKDSSLSIVYKIKDFKRDDFTLLELVCALLASQSSRLLSKKLRDEHELVYSNIVSPYYYFGMLQITSFINKTNKDIVYNKMIEVIESLKDKDLIEPLLDNIKDRKRIQLLEGLDSIFYIFNEHYLDLFKINDTNEERYQKILNITFDDISSFIDRFVIDTVYFIEEGEND